MSTLLVSIVSIENVRTHPNADALDIADSATNEEVNLAKLRIQTRHWTAERWNAPAYAQQKGQQVSINIQGMRMDALRHVEVLEDLSTPKLST